MVQIFGLVDNRLVAYHPAVVVDKDIPHDGKHPPFEIDIVDIFILVVKGFERSVLEQILCLFPVSRKHVGKIQQIVLQIEQSVLKF